MIINNDNNNIKSIRTKLDVKRSETYSVVMTNERSFSVVNASAPGGTPVKYNQNL